MEPILAAVERQNLTWFGACDEPQQPFQNRPSRHLRGERRSGRQRKCWMDNVSEWTSGIPSHAGAAHDGLSHKQKKVEGESPLNRPSKIPDYSNGQGPELN